MANTFSLVDALAARDLQTYLQRATKVEDGSTRLIADAQVLAVYTAILYPRGLLDRTPTVLGLRTVAMAQQAEFDAVVPIRSLLDRLARAAERAEAVPSVPRAAGDSAPIEIGIPLQVSTVTWAGISPPRGGWHRVAQTSTSVLSELARAGVAEVASAIPPQTGEQLVARVRAEVWGRPIEGVHDVPAGVAFAASSLGFLSDEDEVVPIFESGPWTRLTMRRGHALVRRQGWRLRA